MRGIIFVGLSILATTAANAADVCPSLRGQQSAADAATRIAAVACGENMLWYRPFIDANGRIASTTVTEGEASRLGDGVTEAWRRVATYWRESGLLWRMGGFAGGNECAYATGSQYASPACRTFVIDNPWSAAFVSYVMTRAYVPGFRASPSHVDYVRDAYLRPETSPFLYLDPRLAKPAAGDLLCYARSPSQAFGYEGLRQFFDTQEVNGLNMHCDIVVAVNPGNDGKAYLIGGNVQQGVTMRLLAVNRNGNFWALPQRLGSDPPCSPDTESSCNFSRQDWVVLLKLKSPAALALLPGAAPVPASPGMMAPQPAPADCCINCVIGADPPVPRCKN